MYAFLQNVTGGFKKTQISHIRPCLLSQVNIITTKTNAVQNIQQYEKAKILEKENNNFLLNERSKKIQKNTTLVERQPFRNLTNNSNLPQHQSYIEDSLFLQKRKQKIAYLRFQNQRTKKILEFKCYNEADLNIPVKWQQTVIQHQIDNDCTTDDDQIQSAIKTLQSSLESVVKQYSQNVQEDYKSNQKSYSI